MNESDANQKEFYILNLDLELSKLLPEPQDDSGYNEIYEISNKTTWRANVNELLSNKDKRVETLTCLDNEFQKIGTLYETEKDEDDPINNFALFLTAFKTHDQFERFLGKVGVRQKPNSGTVERILRSKPIKDKDNGSNPDRVLDKCCVYIDGSTKTRSCKKKPFPGTTSCLPPIEEHIDPRIVSTVSTFPNASIDGAIKLVYTKVVDELHKLHKSQSSENTARVIRDDSVKNKITNFEFGSSQLQADHVSAISSYLGKRIIDFDVLCEQRLSALSSKQQHFYEDVVEWKNDLIEQGILYATDYDKNLYDNKKFYDTNNTPTEVDHGAYRELMDVWKEKIDFDEVEFRERFREKYDEIQLISIPVDEQKSNSSSHNNEDEDEDKYSSSPTAQPLEFITFGAGKPEQSITERRKLYDDFMGKKWKLGIKMGNRLVGMNPYNNAFLCHRTNTMRSDANEHNSVLRIGSMLPIRERQLLHLLYQLNISFKIVTLHRNGVTIDLGEPIQPTVLSKNHQETATMIHLIPNRFLSDTALEFIDGSMYDTGKAVHDDILGTLSEVVIPLLGDVRRKFLPLYEYYTIPSRHDSVRYKCYHPKCKYGYSDAEKKRTCKNAGWKDFVEHLNFDLSCDACKLSIDEERKKAKHKKTNCDIRRQRRKKCVDCVVQFPLPKKYEENNANCLIEHGIVYQFLYPLDNCITANKWKGDRKRKEIEPDVGTKGTKKKQKKGERQIVKTSKRQIVLLTFPPTQHALTLTTNPTSCRLL